MNGIICCNPAGNAHIIPLNLEITRIALTTYLITH
jgi:hypothetical protein